MAQNAKTSGLTDELLHSILKFDPAANKQAYKHAKDICSRGLRGYQYARTNQFDISSTFTGLDEKFRVKNRDDLADALQSRLQKLDGLTSKFKPEFLSLLLQLSDRPLENTRVEALELLRPPTPPPPLTWDDIFNEDAYSDEDIWKDIDYAVDSSGDERTPKTREKARSSPPTSVDDTYDPGTCIVQQDLELVQQLERIQCWSTTTELDGSKIDITELQAVRETLFMLAGLQTSLYQLDQQQANIRINPRYTLNGTTCGGTVEHLLSELISIGRSAYRLRQWTNRPSTLPLVQTFEANVRKRLVDYDCALAQLQQQYLTPISPIAVSLLQLHADVRSTSATICRLAHLVSEIEPEILVNPFTHLEALFDQTTLAQMTLETQIFRYLSQMFFDCLQTYLKPIRRWMDEGELGSNDETFFIFQNDTGSDATSLWHDRYVLRRDACNNLRTPTFLQPAAKKIFNTGKSIVFLKRLGLYDAGARSSVREPQLDHETICGASDDVPLSPFPDLFQIAFDKWMQSKYSQASVVLRQYLASSGGLMRTLDNLETLYLGRNGAVFENYANALFERMDGGRRGWNDRYVLTELTRTIFSTAMPMTDAEKIVSRSSKMKSGAQSVNALGTVSHDFGLSWPVQNIVQRSSIPIYQQISVLLLQVYRAKYLLQRTRPARTAQSTGRTPNTRLPDKLRHRLTWFADTLRSYLTETVIFFTSREMKESMEKADDIDEMSHAHLTYVAKLQERTMLSKDLKPIHKAIIEILDLAVMFTIATVKLDAGHADGASTGGSAPMRRGSIVDAHASTAPLDSEDDEDGRDTNSPMAKDPDMQKVPDMSYQKMDREFARSLHFVTAGLRSVGRVGAEPMWEQLADRLEWEGKKASHALH